MFTLSAFSCGVHPDSAKIKVTFSTWSGWSPDYVPSETSKIYTVTKQKVLDLHDSSDFSITIKSITDDEIMIITSKPMSDIGNGNINLLTDKTKFVIQKDKVLELITPTTDEGDIYVFEYLSDRAVSDFCQTDFR